MTHHDHDPADCATCSRRMDLIAHPEHAYSTADLDRQADLAADRAERAREARFQ